MKVSEILPETDPAHTHAPFHIRRRWHALLVLIILGSFYALGLNPYFYSRLHDDAAFYFVAQSLATDGTFDIQGRHYFPAAPVLPVILSVPMRFGFDSVWVSKGVVVLMALVALWLFHRLLVLEKRDSPVLVCAILALLPFSYSYASRIMSEWPFMLFSALFLLALHRLRYKRTWKWAALCGVALGTASLTRFVGVTLGAAILAQAWTLARVDRRRSQMMRAVLPETMAALVGATMYLSWILWVRSLPPEEVFPGAMAVFTRPNPGRVLQNSSDVLFLTKKLITAFGLSDRTVPWLISIFPGAVALVGIAIRQSRRELTPGDWYVIATLCLFAIVDWDNSRYLLPVAPFLISYVVTAVVDTARLVRGVPKPMLIGLGRLGITLWLGVLLAADLLYLKRGSRDLFGGACILTSPTPEIFYKGMWRDTYDVCLFLRGERTEGSVLVGPPISWSFVYAWSDRRRAMNYDLDPGLSSYYIGGAADPIPRAVAQDYACDPLFVVGSVVLYSLTDRRKADAAEPAELQVAPRSLAPHRQM